MDPPNWRILEGREWGRMTEIKRAHTRPDDPGLIGQVLGGYRVVAPLSSGGMGAVFRATNDAGKHAAIKVLRPELTGNHELVQRFFTEAKAATALHHPNIVATYEYGYTDDGLAFIVMELLAGQSLAARLSDHKRMSELVAAAIARGIASALTAAHAKGIVHRDLKPDNIYLVPDPEALFGERPVLLDFGIAKLTDPGADDVRHTRTGALIGTPMYMAPEQARAARDIDARADLYSLGCILYELLVGAPPFVAEGAGEIIAMQMFSAPQPPRVLLPSLSPQLEAITLKLLEKEPAARFQTAEEVVEALAGMLGRLSGRVATMVPGASASLPDVLFASPNAAGSAPAISGLLSGKMPMLDEAPPPIEKRSGLMPVIAGILTVAIAGTAVAFVWKRGGTEPAAQAAVHDAAPAAGPTPAIASKPPVAAAIDAGVIAAPPPPPMVVKQDPLAHRPPKHGPSGTTHAVDPSTSSGPTTSIPDSGPVTMPVDDPLHSTGHSPIFQDLGDGSAAAKPAPAPTPPPPTPPPQTPPPAPAPAASPDPAPL